ncbi:unnamed protein product [Rotaria sordida]|uniref:RanBP2-type domain-containing protein n=1 Tax=Rotaria sordida TaxID=392033 RepID=A0A814VHZ5_9BILA|nr:unnamed protein product [Rotaria sordida]CAF1451819.1 unnamed protein product [Rotaria sordida]
MGTTVSQVPSHKPFLEVKQEWTCSQCTTNNPNSVYPICVVCTEKDSNFPMPQSTVSSTTSWRCDLCSFDNEAARQHCTICGKKRIKLNKRELHSANTRIMSAMRPKSVSVRNRQEMDESNAEKIARDAILFCQQNKVTFVDDQFLPSARSLGTSQTDHMTRWLPLAEIAPSTRVDGHLPWTIYNSPEPHDIHQGKLGGRTAEGLQLLTGAPCDRINLHPSNEVLDFDIIWAKLLSACESKLLIGASTGCSEIGRYEYERVGLNPNHAFTVLVTKALPIGDGRFLLVRDPHGTTAYSEASITPFIRTYLRSIHDEMSNSSGIFWITWLSFLHYFDSITISTYVSKHFDIREEAQFTRSPIEPVPVYYFTVSK